jgi:glycosyltransferase involved in cell wall biosynthesis
LSTNQPPARGSGPVVYVASIDLTASAGPAVNEREALLALRRILGPDLVVVVDRPSRSDPDLDAIHPDRFLPPMRSKRPWSLLAHQVAKARILRQELRRVRPRCVVARLDVMPLGLLLGTLGLPVKILLKTASTSSLRLNREKHGRVGVSLHRLLVRGVARKVRAADTVTALRRPIVARELGLPESWVAVIDNGVNVERFHPIDREAARRRCGVDPDAVVFGYAGAQAWTRGGRHLIDAAKALKSEFERPRIVIVGGGESIDRLRDHARALGHDDICVFPGLVPYEDVVWWMNCFDVAVSLETGERARREGHAQQKVRQYTAAGLPVVSALGGNEYLVERGELGSLVDPDVPEAVQEALVRWGRLADDERAAFVERARTFAADRLTVEALNEARVAFWASVGCR